MIDRIYTLIYNYGVLYNIPISFKLKSSIFVQSIKNEFKTKTLFGKPFFEPLKNMKRDLFQEIFVNNQYFFVGNPDVIIDGGANIGMSALYFQKLYPNAVISSYEPVEKNLIFYKKNVKNVVYKLALGNSKGKIMIDSSGSAGNSIYHNSGLIEKVKIVLLSDIIMKVHKNKKIGIKLDIEGSEVNVFQDLISNRIFEKYENIKWINMEYHHNSYAEVSFLGEILLYLQKNNFTYGIQTNARAFWQKSSCCVHINAWR